MCLRPASAPAPAGHETRRAEQRERAGGRDLAESQIEERSVRRSDGRREPCPTWRSVTEIASSMLPERASDSVRERSFPRSSGGRIPVPMGFRGEGMADGDYGLLAAPFPRASLRWRLAGASESVQCRRRTASHAPHRAPARPPAEGLCLLRTPLHVAQEVGAGLAEREVLLGCVPEEGGGRRATGGKCAAAAISVMGPRRPARPPKAHRGRLGSGCDPSSRARHLTVAP